MFRRFWFRLPISSKVRSFAVIVVMIIAIAVVFNIYAIRFSIDGFGMVLDENRSCQQFMDALEKESDDLHEYMEVRSEKAMQDLQGTCGDTKWRMDQLPSDYFEIGPDRYATTWNIRNAYEQYAEKRDSLLQLDSSEENYITDLYEVYDRLDYLSAYARRLMQQTVVDGANVYTAKVPMYRRMPFILANITLFSMLLILFSSRLMTASIVEPVEKLSEQARRIEANDFSVQDVELENRDEIGDLGIAFNRMKHATGDYINTLQERNQIAELLHEEQLSNLEKEKQLENNRMELLKSQINPHFLFNTLNMISSMANLENAGTTEKMTQSLSALFRYNLGVKDQLAFLPMETGIAENYMYLQKMRFGARFDYEIRVPEDADRILIPSFTLQPLIENAVSHGLSRKEQGGKVTVLAEHAGDGRVRVTVKDNGLGMSNERREQIMKRLEGEENGSSSGFGIGLGNIYKRVKGLYGDKGEFLIESEEGKGTSVIITIPDGKEN